MIVKVDGGNIAQAAAIHSISWQESHRSFCSPDFIALHSPEHQAEYLSEKLKHGSDIYMLVEDEPIGVVSVTGSLIEDLYILPEMQNKGCGTRLLTFAVGKCAGTPTLWILENNDGAKRLYERIGFRPTGRVNKITDRLNEMEFELKENKK